MAMLDFVWSSEITLDLTRNDLVDEVLPREGLSVLYGTSTAGKTFFAVDLSCHIGAGMEWRGRKVHPGIVLYVAAENPRSIETRIYAWMRHHEVPMPKLGVIRASVDLMNGSTDKIISAIREIEADAGEPVVLVVVDTLSRAMTGNENAPDDMGKFVAACGRIREACRGHVMIVHHSGKDEARGARGHSSLRAATDVEMEVTREEGPEGPRVATVKKNRDGAEGERFAYDLATFELGLKPSGTMATTCVLQTIDDDGPSPAGRSKVGPEQKITPAQEAVLECIREAVRQRPVESTELIENGPSRAIATSLEAVDEIALERLTTVKDVRKRKQAVKRALDPLVKAGRIVREWPYVWLTLFGMAGPKPVPYGPKPEWNSRNKVEQGGTSSGCSSALGDWNSGTAGTHPYRGVPPVPCSTQGKGRGRTSEEWARTGIRGATALVGGRPVPGYVWEGRYLEDDEPVPAGCADELYRPLIGDRRRYVRVLALDPLPRHPDDFVPSHEWQTVPIDWPVPAGCEVEPSQGDPCWVNVRLIPPSPDPAGPEASTDAA
jgi:hypothetical protein